jgi:hypothetical protein
MRDGHAGVAPGSDDTRSGDRLALWIALLA